MNRIHRKVEYALIALKHMRTKPPGERTSSKEISLTYGCPVDVVARVLQALAAQGILQSEQGMHGGYMIRKDLTRVSFLELIESTLGPLEVARCLSQNKHVGTEKDCDLKTTCNILSPIQNLNRRISDFYRTLTVSELIENRSFGGQR